MGYSSEDMGDGRCASLGFIILPKEEVTILLTADCWVFGFCVGLVGKESISGEFSRPGLVGGGWVGGGSIL